MHHKCVDIPRRTFARNDPCKLAIVCRPVVLNCNQQGACHAAQITMVHPLTSTGPRSLGWLRRKTPWGRRAGSSTGRSRSVPPQTGPAAHPQTELLPHRPATSMEETGRDGGAERESVAVQQCCAAVPWLHAMHAVHAIHAHATPAQQRCTDLPQHAGREPGGSFLNCIHHACHRRPECDAHARSRAHRRKVGALPSVGSHQGRHPGGHSGAGMAHSSGGAVAHASLGAGAAWRLRVGQWLVGTVIQSIIQLAARIGRCRPGAAGPAAAAAGIRGCSACLLLRNVCLLLQPLPRPPVKWHDGAHAYSDQACVGRAVEVDQP